MKECFAEPAFSCNRIVNAIIKACGTIPQGYRLLVPTLHEVQTEADRLSFEDRQDLVAHLLRSFNDMPTGADDEEVQRREREMDESPEVVVTHEVFVDLAKPNRG